MMRKCPVYLNFKSVEIRSSKLGKTKENMDLTKKQHIHSIQLIIKFDHTNYYSDLHITNNCRVQMLLFYMIRENNEILVLNWYITDIEGENPLSEDEYIILIKDHLLDMLYTPEKYNNFEIEIN